jgi:hypothetical protein
MFLLLNNCLFISYMMRQQQKMDDDLYLTTLYIPCQNISILFLNQGAPSSGAMTGRTELESLNLLFRLGCGLVKNAATGYTMNSRDRYPGPGSLLYKKEGLVPAMPRRWPSQPSKNKQII